MSTPGELAFRVAVRASCGKLQKAECNCAVACNKSSDQIIEERRGTLVFPVDAPGQTNDPWAGVLDSIDKLTEMVKEFGKKLPTWIGSQRTQQAQNLMAKAIDTRVNEGWDAMEDYVHNEVRVELQKMVKFPAPPPAAQTAGGSGAPVDLLQQVHEAHREDGWDAIEALAKRRQTYIS